MVFYFALTFVMRHVGPLALSNTLKFWLNYIMDFTKRILTTEYHV